MRFIETKKLNDYVSKSESFFQGDLNENFYEKLKELKSVSLQTFSVKHDKTFLREVAAVLNVIVSIIYHPHLSNKHEEVIIRIEQAHQLAREDFLDTVKDSRLWKAHDLRMIPEEVHYHQYIDELRIYENRFIGFLVDLIDRELAKYSDFYLSRLPTIASRKGSLDMNAVSEIILQIDLLRKKTQFIKNTYFYREVTKGKPISPKIQPTNILLKDRLYCYCFRFYKSLARYEDTHVARSNLCTFYTILLLKDLVRLGFALREASADRYVFFRREFTLTVSVINGQALELTVLCSAHHREPAKHLLLFRTGSEALQTEETMPTSLYEGKEALSLWELSYADGDVISGTQSATEKILIHRWLIEKINRTTADKAVYQKYCPVCGARSPEYADGVYTCPECTSRYMFDENGTDREIWFRKIRKREIS